MTAEKCFMEFLVKWRSIFFQVNYVGVFIEEVVMSRAQKAKDLFAALEMEYPAVAIKFHYCNPGSVEHTDEQLSFCQYVKKAQLSGAVLLEESGITNPSRYRNKTIPTAGALLKEEDALEKQISFDM